MIIITALTLTLALVVLSVSYSDVIYAGSLSSRSSLDTAKSDLFGLTGKVASEAKKAASLANSDSGPVNSTFYAYMDNFTAILRQFYALRGATLNISTENLTIGADPNRTVAAGVVKIENSTFPAGSLIIPMDGNQSNKTLHYQPYSSQLTAYGLVYRILNEVDNATTFNNSPDDGLTTSLPWNIPVAWYFQDPTNLNNSTGNYSMKMYAMNISNSNEVMRRFYYGGPFLVNRSLISDAQNASIVAAAQEMKVNIHVLQEAITLPVGNLTRPPKWATDNDFVKYLARDMGIGADPLRFPADYYWRCPGGAGQCLGNTTDGSQAGGAGGEEIAQHLSTYNIKDRDGNIVPAWINFDDGYDDADAWLRNGSLNSTYDAVLFDHPKNDGGDSFTWDAALGDALADYVEAGGVLAMQCEPAENLDNAVASARGNTYGFIGVDARSSGQPSANPGWKLNNNSSNLPNPFGQVWSRNGYVQSGAKGSGQKYYLESPHNPDVIVLMWEDNDGDGKFDNSDDYGMLSVTFGNGVVRYLAGHNQERNTDGDNTPENDAGNTPNVNRTRLAINQAFYGALARENVDAITSVNLTITYGNRDTNYNVTLRVPVP